MARYDEPTQSQIPDDGTGDLAGWRHFGDGIAGRIEAARIQGYSAADLAYRDIAVDSNGQMQFSLGTGDIQIGAVELKDGTTDQRATVTGSGALKVDGSAVTQPVSGSVSVSNLPAVQPVNDNGGSLTVDGAVSVSNFPALQPVSDNGGSLTVDDGAGSLTVDGTVTANAGTGPWPVTDNGGSLTVDGAVSVSNFPATQTIADGGNVISVDDAGSSLTVDGAVSVSNFPATQPVSGVDLDIRNLDSVQDNVLAKIDLANNDVDVLTEPATAASAGALPALLKVLGGYDPDSKVVRPILSQNYQGEFRLLVSDKKLFNAVMEAVMLLTEIRDLLQEGTGA